MLRVILYALEAFDKSPEDIDHIAIRENYCYALQTYIEEPYREISKFLASQIFVNLMTNYPTQIEMHEDNRIVAASEIPFTTTVNNDVFFCGAVQDMSVVVPLSAQNISEMHKQMFAHIAAHKDTKHGIVRIQS
jgi:hypothetical protein